MRVAIDMLIAEKEPGGMLFATRALLDGLAQTDKVNEYTVITSRPKEYQALATSNMRIHGVKLRSMRGILVQHQLILPKVLRRIQPDVLHVPAFAAPIGWNGPMVLTVHDLAFLKVPQQSSLYARLYWQYLLRESVRRAQQIIVVSKQTREELSSYWSVDTNTINVIHNALRPSLQAETLTAAKAQAMRQRYGGRYLLHVGRIMPRKNVETLLAAFDLIAGRFPDLNLVLAGGAGYASEGALQQRADSPYRERIRLTGWIPEQEMGPLYAGASALVFPSKHEGFGLPTIEAMACGTPVVASPEAASQEVAGDAVLRTDCTNAATLAATLVEILTDTALSERLVRLGKVQAQPFTSNACAYATRHVYEQALGTAQQPIALQVL